MKKLILSMAALAIMLTSCDQKDITSSLDGETTTVKASFGFNQSNAMATSVENRDVPSAIAGIEIYKRVPCNVRGFDVKAVSSGHSDVTNYYVISEPSEIVGTTDDFNLENIYVGDNVFTTTLDFYDEVSNGVSLNNHREYNLLNEDDLYLFNESEILADFDSKTSTTNSITVEAENNTATIDLGHFTIKNGGAKITFTGDDQYYSHFIMMPSYVADRVMAADQPAYSVADPLACYVNLNLDDRKGLVINDNSFGESETREYTITVATSTDDSAYYPSSVSAKITLYKKYFQNFSISLDKDFNIIVDELSNVEISIDDFGVTVPQDN